MWIDAADRETDQEIGYLIELTPDGGKARYALRSKPGRIIATHEPELFGGLGAMNGMALRACGLSRVMMTNPSGTRVQLMPVAHADAVEFLTADGYPELVDALPPVESSPVPRVVPAPDLTPLPVPTVQARIPTPIPDPFPARKTPVPEPAPVTLAPVAPPPVEPARLLFPLADGAPVSIVDKDWPIVLQMGFDLIGYMQVRRHADGRRIASGADKDGLLKPGYYLLARTDKPEKELDLLALLPVAHDLHKTGLVRTELAKLPPIALD